MTKMQADTSSHEAIVARLERELREAERDCRHWKEMASGNNATHFSETMTITLGELRDVTDRAERAEAALEKRAEMPRQRVSDREIAALLKLLQGPLADFHTTTLECCRHIASYAKDLRDLRAAWDDARRWAFEEAAREADKHDGPGFFCTVGPRGEKDHTEGAKLTAQSIAACIRALIDKPEGGDWREDGAACGNCERLPCVCESDADSARAPAPQDDYDGEGLKRIAAETVGQDIADFREATKDWPKLTPPAQDAPESDEAWLAKTPYTIEGLLSERNHYREQYHAALARAGAAKSTRVSEAAVEAGCKAAARVNVEETGAASCLDNYWKQFRKEVRAALEAAAPHMAGTAGAIEVVKRLRNGFGHLRDALMSDGPKQACGEQCEYWLREADKALAALREEPRA